MKFISHKVYTIAKSTMLWGQERKERTKTRLKFKHVKSNIIPKEKNVKFVM